VVAARQEGRGGSLTWPRSTQYKYPPPVLNLYLKTE
jgi:hypothetical protein